MFYFNNYFLRLHQKMYTARTNTETWSNKSLPTTIITMMKRKQKLPKKMFSSASLLQITLLWLGEFKPSIIFRFINSSVKDLIAEQSESWDEEKAERVNRDIGENSKKQCISANFGLCKAMWEIGDGGNNRETEDGDVCSVKRAQVAVRNTNEEA